MHSDIYGLSSGNYVVNAGINYARFYKGVIGFETGIEFSTFKTTTEYRGAFRAKRTVFDKDFNSYYPGVHANYTEARKIYALDIPLLLKINIPIEKEYAYFIFDVGMKANCVFLSKIIRNGTMSTVGYYTTSLPNAFILVEDDPEYGYYTSNFKGSGDFATRFFNYGIYVSTGFKFKINENYWLSLSPYYFIGINDIVPFPYRVDYRDIFGTSYSYKPTYLRQAGFKIGLVYSK